MIGQIKRLEFKSLRITARSAGRRGEPARASEAGEGAAPCRARSECLDDDRGDGTGDGDQRRPDPHGGGDE